MTRRPLRPLAAGLLALALAACSGDSDTPTLSDQAVPDFALMDVNPASPTSGMSVTVRDHLGHVSAWYFAHAT